MVFGSIEKPPSIEGKKLEEESMGGPWDKNYKEQLDIGKEEKKEEEKLELINPLKGMDEGKIRREIEEKRIKKESSVSRLAFDAGLHEEESKRFRAVMGGSRVIPENPLKNDEAWKRYRKKISDIRESQPEI